MLIIKNGLVVALLVASVPFGASERMLRGQDHGPDFEIRELKKKDKKSKIQNKAKKKGGSGGAPVVSMAGVPGGFKTNPTVWSPSDMSWGVSRTPNSVGSGQYSQSQYGQGQPVITSNNPSYPTTTTSNAPIPMTRATSSTTNTYTVSTIGGTGGTSMTITGIPCVQGNTKFRCCNNGISDCGGEYDCCDAYRNTCVNTASLERIQLRNLVCKAETSQQQQSITITPPTRQIVPVDVPPATVSTVPVNTVATIRSGTSSSASTVTSTPATSTSNTATNSNTNANSWTVTRTQAPGGASMTIMGYPCVDNGKFKCCNNGISECGSEYDCCDAIRNTCVNTSSLKAGQLRNLQCKPDSGQVVPPTPQIAPNNPSNVATVPAANTATTFRAGAISTPIKAAPSNNNEEDSDDGSGDYVETSPANTVPATSTFTVTRSQAPGGASITINGIPCVENGRFKCCNSGISECGGEYDCCDAYRNTCVNTQSLGRAQLRNLMCKPESDRDFITPSNMSF